jgi:pimeloyl-ACP methyl ester carboxylesterase
VTRLRALLVAVATVLAVAPAAEAQLRFCGPGDKRACARLTVPLDRTGVVPGEIHLNVERRRTKKPVLPPLFLLAGGPGQGATPAFLQEFIASQLRPVLKKRDLIVFDQRGTGRSGVLRCEGLERANLANATVAAGRCARKLGPRRAFYTTRDSAEDIEAIRRALGAEKIALFGISYGTKTALAYALAHPDRVERLGLDSVVEASGPDPFYRDSFEAVPRVLRALCGGACRSFTRNPSRDVQRLVRRVARRPLQGKVFDVHGKAHRARLRGFDLFSLLAAGDFDLDLRSQTPAAVSSALHGDLAPVLRLVKHARAVEDIPEGPKLFSPAAYAATVCEEAPFPWQRGAPFEQRRAISFGVANDLGPAAFRPFDVHTATDSDFLRLCERWAEAPAPPALGSGPLPDVPVLLLEGDQDLRTPVENARRVAAQFPQAKLLVARDTGHDAFDADLTLCAEEAVKRFFSGRRPPGRCPDPQLLRPTKPLPRSLRALRPLRGEPGRRGRTLRAVGVTLRDMGEQAAFQFFVRVTQLLEDLESGDFSRLGALFEPFGVPGLRGGRGITSIDTERLRLRRVLVVPGVRVSGKIDSLFGRMHGRLRVRGRAAARGRIRLSRKGLVTGRLGGRRVRGHLRVRVAGGGLLLFGELAPIARTRW